MGEYLYLLVYFAVTCSLVCGQSIKYVLKGLEVNLKPHITGHPEEILWKHNGNKVVEFDGREQQVYGQFENRVTLDWVSAELNIKDLRYEDSGQYEVETYINRVFERSSYAFVVIEKVAKPNISCVRSDSSSSTTHGNQAMLVCSAESRQPQYLKYEWISHGSVQPGQRLTITLSNDDKEYSCRVSNPLTNETAVFNVKDCYPDESPYVPLIAGIIASGMAAFFAFFIIWCKRKQKGCFAKRKRGDFEEEGSKKEKNKNHVLQNEEHDHLQNEEHKPFIHSTKYVNSSPSFAIKSENKESMDPNDPDRNLTEDIDSYPKKGIVQQRIREHNQKITKIPDTSTGLNKNAENDPKTTSQHPPLSGKPSSCVDNVLVSVKDDVNLVKETDSLGSEEAPEPDPGGVLDHNEDPCTASEQPEPEKEADQDVGVKFPPANDVSCPVPIPRPRSRLPNMETKDTTGEHQEGADSNQVTGKP